MARKDHLEDMSVDFETFSECDIKVGARKYARHRSTDALCMAYRLPHAAMTEIWIPGQPIPAAVKAHLLSGKRIRAWNSEFERYIFTFVMGPKYGWPVPKIEQYVCTMTEALAMGFPGALAQAAPAIGLDIKKDDVGRRIMLTLCKPRILSKTNKRARWTPETGPGQFKILYEYCKQDVNVELAIAERVVPLHKRERTRAHMAARINDRGIHIDRTLITAANNVVQEQLRRLDAEMREVTDNAVPSCSATKALVNYLGAGGLKWPETESPSVAKEPLARLLARDDLTNNQRVVLLLRQEAAKTSTAKLEKFEDCADENDDVHGTIQFSGAATGRDAARGVQVQNFPRPSKKTPIAAVIQALRAGATAQDIECLFGPPMSIVSDILRSCIVARPGKILMARDLSQIEARMTAWIAGEEKKLAAFRAYDRKEGPDIYTVAAAGIYDKPPAAIDKEGNERQTGKVSELALGFGGGAGAYGSMAKIYGIDLNAMFPSVWALADDELRERAQEAYAQFGKKRSGMSKKAWLACEITKVKWRGNNQEIAQSWKDVEEAAIAAVLNPGSTHTARSLTFRKTGSFLRMVLPSGRSMFYPYPRISFSEPPWGGKPRPKLHHMGVDGMTKQFREFATWGGTIFQNAVQAASRDAMFEIVERCEDAGFENTMRIHDEGVFEVDENERHREAELHALFVQESEFHPGLPIAADGWVGPCYRK